MKKLFVILFTFLISLNLLNAQDTLEEIKLLNNDHPITKIQNNNPVFQENNIIILDEGSSSVYLWYGAKQGLVSRRTALRQAESLKGHGFSVGRSIVGRDIKTLREIDQRKIGRVPEIDELNDELQTLLNRGF